MAHPKKQTIHLLAGIVRALWDYTKLDLDDLIEIQHPDPMSVQYLEFIAVPFANDVLKYLHETIQLLSKTTS